MVGGTGVEEVIEFIRLHLRTDEHVPVTASSMLERDLGVDADKGVRLLWGLQEQFGVAFAGADRDLRTAFGLAADEALFFTDAVEPGTFVAGLLSTDARKVRPLSVGRLHEVIVALQGRQADEAASP